MPSFKTPRFCADVINIWFFAPKIFKSNYLTYLSVALSFQLKKRLYFKISAGRRIRGIGGKLRKLRIINIQRWFII